MNAAAAPLARPLRGCLVQAALRRTAARRWASTAPTKTAAAPVVALPPARPAGFQSIETKDGRIRTAFAVYAPVPRPAATTTTTPTTPTTTEVAATAADGTAPAKPPTVDVLRAFDQQQIARMDPTGARTQLFSRKNPDSAKPGDVLLVTPSKAGAEAFAGVCLAIRRAGIETAILLRGQLAKTGVEMWFKIYSRAVAAIDIVQRSPRRARRAKLTYMRKPKHDRGSVEDLVKTWRRSRNVMRSRSSGAAAAAAGGSTGPTIFAPKSKKPGKK